MRSIRRSCLPSFTCTLFIYWIYVANADRRVPVVSTPEDSNTNAIEGFGTDLQCYVDTCTSLYQQVEWYKNDKKISQGTQALQSRYNVRHSIKLSDNCYGTCSDDDKNCPGTQFCRLSDTKCCTCASEEFTLVLSNVTMNDSATYSCRLNGSNSVNVRLLVVESGTFPAFGQNLTFNYSACCQSRGMSDECMPLCKPNSIQTQRFDPLHCRREFSKLLQCATDNGNISHVHCCRLHFVPAFCWDYCSGKTTDFGRANPLCVYWMPEIFQCYEQAYLPFPGPPENLVVNAINDTAVKACWDIPNVRGATVEYYTVRYQEVPQFSFFSANMPFVTSSRGGSSSEENQSNSSSNSGGQETSIERRKKRQTLFLTTHHFATNMTEVREYRYMEVNTTDTCVEITNLKPSTHYFVYVTSTNNYGPSLPSLRENVVTAPITFVNDSLPNIYGCCIKNGVEEKCASKMCDLRSPPSAVSTFDLAYTCKKDFGRVSPCLADGRDHTECCKEKGVIGECLKFCDGSAQHLGMSSILCLSLDIQSIFSCFRRGYAVLPSPPTNVTVVNIQSTSAKVMWTVPATNSDKVNNYSVFYGPADSEVQTEIKEASNPYTLMGLLPEKRYQVYVVARSDAGSSLKSTVVTFYTSEPGFENVCSYGKPLLDAFGQPLKCSNRVRCPESHKCTDTNSDDPEAKYCCPLDSGPLAPSVRVEPPNVTECCSRNGVTQDCIHLCNYKTTADDLTKSGISCAIHLQAYVDCGIDGRNNVQCCKSERVTEGLCTNFCTPLKNLGFGSMIQYLPCIKDANKIIKCALEGVLYRPGPPLNISIEDSGSTWMTLHWKRPSQKVPVEKYEIRINNASVANATGLSYTINGLEPNRAYVVDVISWNERGSSVPSEPYPTVLSKTASKTSINDDKPRPPNTIRLQSYSDRTANVTWSWRNVSVTYKPINRVEFRLMYAPRGSKPSSTSWKMINTSNTFVEVNDLDENKQYDMKVIAVNAETGKESLPSEINVITTINDDSNNYLELWTDPHGYIQEGDYVVVHCMSKGAATSRPLTLKHGQTLLAKGVSNVNYTFQKIRVEDSQTPLFCLMDYDGRPIQKKELLKVRHRPFAEADSPIVAVSKGDPVSLTCRVQGFPHPKSDWLYSSTGNVNLLERVQGGWNKMLFEAYADPGQTTFDVIIQINNALTSDAGLYVCRSCNELGCANATTRLIVESFKLPSGPDHMKACCKRRNVNNDCLPKCTASFDWFREKSDDQCSSEIFHMLACTRDGIDNRRCCHMRGVPENCLQYCNGVLLDHEKEVNVNKCSNYRNEIVNCVSEGHKILPPTPEIEDMTDLKDGRINVSWNVPASLDNGNSIQYYVLYYKSMTEQNYTQNRVYNKTYVVLDNLEQNVPYEMTLLSVNNRGPSDFSPPRSLEFSEAAASTARSGSGGLIFGLILLLLLIGSAVLSYVYFSRRPQKMPTFLLKMAGRRKSSTSGIGGGAVAFENPGYDSEGQVHVLSANGGMAASSSGSNGITETNAGWQSAKLESPRENATTLVESSSTSSQPEQRGMNYAQLIS